VSLSRLAQSIGTQLRGTAVGYVALVGRSPMVASGLARTAADPPKLAMGLDVMVNVASVGKMFTTIAVLQSLARHHLSIDSRISPFLPPDWVKSPGVATITFRELLTHRAGFRLDSGLVFTTDNAARDQVRHGIDQVDQQVPSYNNINFTIFRDLLPFLEGARDQGPAANRFFIAYVQRQVFGPVGVTDATCAPVREAMLMYPSPFVPAALLRDRTGEHGRGGTLGVRGRRLVYDAGQHAPGPPGPDQRQAAVRGPAAADGRQLPGLGLLHRRPNRLPGQVRRLLRWPSGPADLLRHPRRVDPGGDSHNSNGPPPLQAVVQTALRAATSPR
jgi:CubicO group peptidase (beta-lactamase class C family)